MFSYIYNCVTRWGSTANLPTPNAADANSDMSLFDSAVMISRFAEEHLSRSLSQEETQETKLVLPLTNPANTKFPSDVNFYFREIQSILQGIREETAILLQISTHHRTILPLEFLRAFEKDFEAPFVVHYEQQDCLQKINLDFTFLFNKLFANSQEHWRQDLIDLKNIILKLSVRFKKNQVFLLKYPEFVEKFLSSLNLEHCHVPKWEL